MPNRSGRSGVLLFTVLAPLAALVLRLALSRSREYEADWSGAEPLADGEPLACALAKLDRASAHLPMRMDPAHASACIVNLLAVVRGRVPMVGLFSDHPPTPDRIARLRSYRLGAGRR